MKKLMIICLAVVKSFVNRRADVLLVARRPPAQQKENIMNTKRNGLQVGWQLGLICVGRGAKKQILISLVALLALGLIADARAGIITPSRLQPGQQFRVVFVTTAQTSASSFDISSYDTIVQGEATAAGIGIYNNEPVTWGAIGTTPAVSAVDRLPVDNVPIFLPDGTEVAPSGAALWNTANVDLLSPINETATGSLTDPEFVWTGTGPAGGRAWESNCLGNWMNLLTPLGSTASIDSGWVYAARDGTWYSYKLYGFSSILTAPVPEPATICLLGFGALSLIRRKSNNK
jgi:hypothetical protein